MNVKERKQRAGKRRSGRKRIFHGNQYTNISESPVLATADELSEQQINQLPTVTETPTQHSSSAKKVNGLSTSVVSENSTEEKAVGYRLIDMEILCDIFKPFACPECFSSEGITVTDHCNKKYGFSSYLSVSRNICMYSRHFYTSKRRGKNNKGWFDVNVRSVYAFRACGIGHEGMKKFLTYMNMPKPMTYKNYNKLNNVICKAVKSVAEGTTSDAANELKIDPNSITDVGITCDGSWQCRGFSSLNGIVSVISVDSGKCLDVEPLSKFCKACSMQENLRKTDPDAHDIWMANHSCKMNFYGSSPAMEPEGTKKIFARSIEKHNLRYVSFYGDGDSKSHPAVQDIYEGLKVKKLECIGHAQKRVGNRLRNLKTKVKGLGGKGKLTLSMIDKLQNYYGIAIRSNVGDLEGMQKAVLASLFHVASSSTSNWHTYCPTGHNSWCLFQRDKALGTSTYKAGPGLPLSVVAKVKPVYQDLSSESHLIKCLHGKTQNTNESFNGMVWQRVPKNRYVGFTQVEIGLYDAVAHFNTGSEAALNFLEHLKLTPGKYCIEGCHNINDSRVMKIIKMKQKENG